MASLTPRIDNLEGRANYIINGHMQFAQRNTTFNINNSNAYTLDRWQIYHTGYGAGNDITVEQSTDVPSFAQAGYTFPASLKLTNNDNAPGTGTTQIVHRLEGYNYQQLHSRWVKIQYWVKSSLTGIYSLGLANSANNRTYVTEFTINSADTWELKEHLIQLDSSGTWLFTNGSGLLCVWALQAPSAQTSTFNQWKSDSNNYSVNQVLWASASGRTFNITGVQVTPVLGSESIITLPFSTFGGNYIDDLEACQRYCVSPQDADSGSSAVYGVGACRSTTEARIMIHLPVTMRSPPILSSHSAAASNFALVNAAGATVAATVIAVSATGTGRGVVHLSVNTASGLVAGDATFLFKVGAANQLIFDAEL